MSAFIQLTSVIEFLESFAPLNLAEDWDNVGLLLGDRQREVSKVMTSLTITPSVVEEAVAGKVNLIVSHHPLPFRSLKKINGDTVAGRLILKLIENRVAVFSPHTAFDSAAGGINQSIADKLQLENIESIQPIAGMATGDPDTAAVPGAGRTGVLPGQPKCRILCQELKNKFGISVVKFCGDLDASVSKVGIACGSAGQLLTGASLAGCDAFITGEASFHTCLEALASGISLFLLGHYGSERFAVEMLAQKMAIEFPGLLIHASVDDRDPIQYVS